MKYLLKISLLLCGVFCFILACEQKEPAKADLTSYDEIFRDGDTMPAVGPAALRVIFGEKRFWRLSDSTFALMSQDTSSMLETVVREDSLFAWLMTKLPDSLGLTGDVYISGKIRLGAIEIINGTGSPEGSVTAPVGSMYLNSSGGAGETLWIKESGAGNTGWVAASADASADGGGF